MCVYLSGKSPLKTANRRGLFVVANLGKERIERKAVRIPCYTLISSLSVLKTRASALLCESPNESSVSSRNRAHAAVVQEFVSDYSLNGLDSDL